MYSKYKKANGEAKLICKEKYIKYRNIYNKLIKGAKVNYYRDQFEFNRGNSKKTWEIINKLLNKMKIDNYECEFKYKNVKTNNKNEITNYFCEYFTNIGPELASKIQRSNNTYETYFKNIPQCPNSIYMNPVEL